MDPTTIPPHMRLPITWSLLLHGLILVWIGVAAGGWLDRTSPRAERGSTSFGEIRLVDVAASIRGLGAHSPHRQKSPSPSPSAEAVGIGTSHGTLEATYLERLHALIESKKSYPLRAKQLDMSGRVLLRFFVLPNGSLERIEVESSSGYDLLDEAAVQAVRSVERFEAFPEDWDARELELRLPVQFSLQ